MDIDDGPDEQERAAILKADVLRQLRASPGYQEFRQLCLDKVSDLYNRWMAATTIEEHWRTQAGSQLAWEFVSMVDDEISQGDHIAQLVQERHQANNEQLRIALRQSEATRAEHRKMHTRVRS